MSGLDLGTGPGMSDWVCLYRFLFFGETCKAPGSRTWSSPRSVPPQRIAQDELLLYLYLRHGDGAFTSNGGEGSSPPVVFSPGTVTVEVGGLNSDGYDDLINYKTLLLNFRPF